MKTIIYEADQAQYEAVKSGITNYVVIKGDYQIGQKMILQGPDDEIPVTVSYVQTSPGLMKGHQILSFEAVPANRVPVKLEFLPDADQEIHLPHDEPLFSPSTTTLLSEIMNDFAREAAQTESHT